MSISYQWVIKKLSCFPLLDGKQNVVCSISWELHGTNERNVSAFVFGNQEISYEQDASFVSFEELKQSEVQNWLLNGIGEVHVAAYQKNVAETIESMENPKVITPALPWAN